jgi:hypothetical protein
MKIVMAKGVNFLFARKYIENKYSTVNWDRIMQYLSNESKTVWSGVLPAGSEYPFAAFKEMMSSVNTDLKTAKDPEIAEIYEYIADQSLNKTYKILFKLANPSCLIKNYPKLCNMFFNTGTVEVQVAESGHAVLRFLLPEIFNDWLPPACLGYSKKAVEMAGGRNLVMKKNSSGKTSDDLWETIYDLRWME